MMTGRTLSLALALYLGGATANLLAMLGQDLAGIAARVKALGDAEATRAFNTLKERRVFEVDLVMGDPLREIRFKVHSLGDPAITRSFEYLKAKGAFQFTEDRPLTEQERQALESVRSALKRFYIRAAVARLVTRPETDEGFWAFVLEESWLAGKIAGSSLFKAKKWLSRADGLLAQFEGRTDPKIKAMGDEYTIALDIYRQCVSRMGLGHTKFNK